MIVITFYSSSNIILSKYRQITTPAHKAGQVSPHEGQILSYYTSCCSSLSPAYCGYLILEILATSATLARIISIFSCEPPPELYFSALWYFTDPLHWNASAICLMIQNYTDCKSFGYGKSILKKLFNNYKLYK